MTWVIGIPAFGRRYVDLLISNGLSHYREALRNFNQDVKFFIHTDHPEIIDKAFGDLNHMRKRK